MDAYKSGLRPDGTVFPPVTPDPPPTPGRVIVEAPDIVAEGGRNRSETPKPDDVTGKDTDARDTDASLVHD